MRAPLPNRPVSVAALTLHVSGTPGTYTLGLTNATYSTVDDQAIPMDSGLTFSITVQGGQ